MNFLKDFSLLNNPSDYFSQKIDQLQNEFINKLEKFTWSVVKKIGTHPLTLIVFALLAYYYHWMRLILAATLIYILFKHAVLIVKHIISTFPITNSYLLKLSKKE